MPGDLTCRWFPMGVTLIPLDEMSVRAANHLRNENLLTLGQVWMISDAEFLRRPEFSWTMLAEIRRVTGRPSGTAAVGD